MTLDLTKLSWPSLDAVRKALGANERGDTTYDDAIHNMSPQRYVELYAQWHLGDPGWGANLYSLVHEADAAEDEALGQSVR